VSRYCNRLRFGTLLWVVVSAGCGATQPAEERQVRYVAETMNIREQPGTSGRVLRKAPPGSVLHEPGGVRRATCPHPEGSLTPCLL
jgi:hypothetical protein